MGTISNIACKTIGLAGMGVILYDTYSNAKHHAGHGAEELSADYFEHVHDASRTTSTESPATNAMQRKIANLRMNNPIVPILGKIKGFCSGAAHSLADNIIPVTFASIAVGTRGFLSKLGAIGLIGFGAFKALHEGFGIGKKTSIDD